MRSFLQVLLQAAWHLVPWVEHMPTVWQLRGQWVDRPALLYTLMPKTGSSQGPHGQRREN